MGPTFFKCFLFQKVGVAGFLITHASGSRGMGKVISCMYDFVCLSATSVRNLNENGLNYQHRVDIIIQGKPSACTDPEDRPEVKRSKNSVTWLSSAN